MNDSNQISSTETSSTEVSITQRENKPSPLIKGWQYIVYFVLLLWVIESAEELFNISFSPLSIFPQNLFGLVGVIFAPFLHSNYDHLIANSLPLLLLGGLLFYGYPVSKWKTIAIVWVISGVGVWLFGRPSYHLGASGIVSGLFYFLFFASIFRRDKRSIALMFIAVLMYGGILLGILPWDPKISFESHLFGAVGGIFSALLFRSQDPKLERKIYDWEFENVMDEQDNAEDTSIERPPYH